MAFPMAPSLASSYTVQCLKVGHMLVAAVMGTVAFLFARGLVRDVLHVFHSLSSGLKVGP
jgi:hypothetical protein